MQAYLPYLDPLDLQEQSMLDLLESWVNINSWSDHLAGLEKMLSAVENAFSNLNGTIEHLPLSPRKKFDSHGHIIEVPSGNALSIKKRPNAPFKALLAGHIDTVYPPTSPFQLAERLDREILRGPGAADMKGGLVILLKALEVFENSPFAEQLGWEILINPDEEVGSPSSEHLFVQKAPNFNVGLIFEPAFSDGSLVNERKGSINYVIISHGVSAHAGRDYYSGRNAISAMARLIQEIEALNDRQREITVNIGAFEGGGQTNIVPDFAICKINIRMQNPKDLQMISTRIGKLIKSASIDGITFDVHEQTIRPPKLFNKSNRLLFEAFKDCADGLGHEIKWQPSGGVCDGNTLSAAGLPTIDTLGPIGGHIHTHDEYIRVNSLIPRAKLAACFLMQLADKKHLLENIND